MPNQSKLLATAIALALASPLPATAATITVTSLADGFLVIGSMACTLRLAVQAANDNSPQAGCAAGDVGGVDLIEFGSGLSIGTITLTQGEMEISSSLTIQTNPMQRQQITVSADNASRIFNITDDADEVTLRGLTMRDGAVVNLNGGAVYSDANNLLIDNCTFIGNTANFGPGTVGASGGAVLARGTQTTLRSSTVSGNSSSFRGGGVAVSGGASLNVIDSTFSDNSSSNGGGLANASGGAMLTINGGSFTSNTAGIFGGALFSQGEAQISEVTFANNTSTGDGGGIATGLTTMSLTNSSFSGNTANEMGGGLLQLSSGTTTVTGGSFNNNRALDTGGGMAISGELTLTDVTFQGNSSNGLFGGGAIVVTDTGNLQMNGGAVTNNDAERGGGLMGMGSATLTEVTLSDNTASVAGGGIYAQGQVALVRSTVNNNSALNGAGLYVRGGANSVTSLNNVTLSNNTSVISNGSLYGAAVYAFSSLSITNSTLLNNVPNGITKVNGGGQWNITNTVIAGSGEADCVDMIVAMDQNLNNLFADGSCAGSAIDPVFGPPMLGPLADNGGPTQTHQPLTGSPIVDAGNNVSCPNPDQTGMPRPIDGNADGDAECDIGSVEFVDLFGPLRTLNNAPDITTPSANAYQLTVTYTDLDGEVDFATSGINDITVLPGPLVVQGTSLSGTSSQLSVTYTLQPPGGSWDAGDSGTYIVSMNNQQVFDTAITGANAVAAGELGQFEVLIPEVDVSGNGVSIADGDDSPASADGTNLGQIPVGNTQQQTFVIQNLGSGTVNLTAAVEIIGADFSVSQPPDIALDQGESTAFQVNFAPQSVGVASAVVTVLNDDADEGVYSFSLQGEAVAASEIVFSDGFESAP